MNDYHILLTQQAKEDIISIGDYISYILSEPDTSKNFYFKSLYYATTRNASSKSSIISAIFSVPMDKRMVFGLIP